MLKLFKNEPIPEKWKSFYLSTLHPIVRLLANRNMHPNVLTTCGFIASLVASYWMAIGSFRIGAGFILLAGICDTIDGKLARDSKKVSKFGALFDSTLDRYSETLLFFGMAYYYIKHDLYATSIGVAIALGGSLMVSYIRARAEGLGFECKVGILQRSERLLLLVFGALIHPVALTVAIWIIAVLSNVTAVVRIVHVWKEDQKHRAVLRKGSKP